MKGMRFCRFMDFFLLVCFNMCLKIGRGNSEDNFKVVDFIEAI